MSKESLQHIANSLQIDLEKDNHGMIYGRDVIPYVVEGREVFLWDVTVVSSIHETPERLGVLARIGTGDLGVAVHRLNGVTEAMLIDLSFFDVVDGLYEVQRLTRLAAARTFLFNQGAVRKTLCWTGGEYVELDDL